MKVRKRCRSGNEDLVVTSLPKKKMGRPLLLGEELEIQVKAYLTSFREKGAVINTAIVRACAEGIVKK